jgi:hypothetical protein
MFTYFTRAKCGCLLVTLTLLTYGYSLHSKFQTAMSISLCLVHVNYPFISEAQCNLSQRDEFLWYAGRPNTVSYLRRLIPSRMVAILHIWRPSLTSAVKKNPHNRRKIKDMFYLTTLSVATFICGL